MMVSETVTELGEDAFFAELNAAYEGLRQDPTVWACLEAERDESDRLLLDDPDDSSGSISSRRQTAASILAHLQVLGPQLHPCLWDEGKPMIFFGALLMRLRLAAGFPSLDSVVRATRARLPIGKKASISKSMLSIYERGDVRNIKTEMLWLLAQLYRVDYANLVRCWAQERFRVSFEISSKKPPRAESQ